MTDDLARTCTVKVPRRQCRIPATWRSVLCHWRDGERTFHRVDMQTRSLYDVKRRKQNKLSFIVLAHPFNVRLDLLDDVFPVLR